MLTTIEALSAGEETYQLAEGPRWDAARGRLVWVDIYAGEVLRGTVDGPGLVTVEHRDHVDGMVGAALPTTDGGLVLAAQEHVAVLGADRRLALGPRVVPAGSGRRCNDATTDPAGRLLVGTLTMDGGSDHEALVRLEPDGSLTTLDDDLGQANGIAFSTDGTRMYSVDTTRHVVHARDYDAATGRTGPRAVHLDLGDALPDGITVDAADHLWVAVFGAGEVRRFSPTGVLDTVVRVPAPHTTSAALAGGDLRTLVVTTGSAELDDAGRAAHPLSGRLFSARVDVPGVPVVPWRAVPFG
ncbi:SMP-30/gluconolactonase/LRE family protein [Aquipuribacter nitratireducens]|uniref:SMP-30/gluconolactonase/LRE family protein n=1 Tax=Aquipuribacter nitratireducens TaxID=650104 RepID=A0ABW0GHY0_9MICO